MSDARKASPTKKKIVRRRSGGGATENVGKAVVSHVSKLAVPFALMVAQKGMQHYASDESNKTTDRNASSPIFSRKRAAVGGGSKKKSAASSSPKASPGRKVNKTGKAASFASTAKNNPLVSSSFAGMTNRMIASVMGGAHRRR